MVASNVDDRGYEWILWPLLDEPGFEVDELAFVVLKRDRETGMCRVVALNVQEPEQYRGRHKVQFFDKPDSYAHLRPGKICKLYTGKGPRVLLMPDTGSFRALARSQVCQKRVMEIGSSYGVCTAILAQTAASVIGLETSEELIRESRAAYPHIRFEHVDCVLERDRVLQLASPGVDVVFLDIGGDRGLGALVDLIPWLQKELKPELIVVKSRNMHRSAVEVSGVQGGAVVEAAQWWAGLEDGCRSDKTEEVASKWEEHARALEGWQAEGAPTTSGTGSGTDLSEWRRDQAGKRFRGYPLHFPIVYNELGQNVCRFFNYGACLKGDACPHDHSSCHVCLGKGHRAQECTLPSHFGGGKVSGIVDTKTLASIQ